MGRSLAAKIAETVGDELQAKDPITLYKPTTPQDLIKKV